VYKKLYFFIYFLFGKGDRKMKIANRMFYLRATYDLLKTKMRSNVNAKIKVGFMVRMIELINKCKPLIDNLLADERFEVYILCVPSNIEDGRLIKSENNNDIYEYCKQFYSNSINTLNTNGTWVDIKEYDLDYVFYSHPYDSVYPHFYKSKNVCKWSKICVLLYGMLLTKEMLNIMLNKKFFRNVYLYFAETSYVRDFNINRFPITHKFGLQKSICLGMPSLQDIYSRKCLDYKKSLAWTFSENIFRVIWTPRYTTRLKLGGSNFFTYYKELIEYADSHKDIDFLFRPHPLTFKNFIKTGEMTETEVLEFQSAIRKRKNVALDVEKEYVDTFLSSSVLVTDISSIMAEYFVTGKPIIYCASNMTLEVAEHTQRIIDGCYVVYNKKELFSCLAKLKNGIDELKGIRESIVTELFGDYLKCSTEKIVEEIVSDYNV